jgi:hypothetical protein
MSITGLCTCRSMQSIEHVCYVIAHLTSRFALFPLPLPLNMLLMADPFATRLQELVPLAASCTSVVDACGVGKGGSESGVQGRISIGNDTINEMLETTPVAAEPMQQRHNVFPRPLARRWVNRERLFKPIQRKPVNTP